MPSMIRLENLVGDCETWLISCLVKLMMRKSGGQDYY